ncbi:MAG: F0F1 ATP synthase subunit epsilon [Odoribacter sp.]|nr:F0F1 ATP synthase subunit epsilon [Odoribacter sp.]
MTLKIISAVEILFEGTVSSVTLPGTSGQFTVLHNHASLVSTLTAGDIAYTDDNGNRNTRHIDGGIADIDNNVISVCLY